MRRTRNKPLPRRDYHYDLEMLEPRLLLSVALNDNSGIQVQNQIQTQVANLFD